MPEIQSPVLQAPLQDLMQLMREVNTFPLRIGTILPLTKSFQPNLKFSEPLINALEVTRSNVKGQHGSSETGFWSGFGDSLVAHDMDI
jgi:hypothetical protein